MTSQSERNYNKWYPNAAYLKHSRQSFRMPYNNGSIGRVFPYGMGGSTVNTAEYGPLPGDNSRALSALIEISNLECFDGYRYIEHDALRQMERDQLRLALNLLEAAPRVVNGTYLSNKLGHEFALPHVYRIDTDLEHPKLRVGADKMTVSSVDFSPPPGYTGSTNDDRTIDGVRYKTWNWEPSSPYDFPGKVTVCPEEGESECATAAIGDGPVDLCGTSNWSASGWQFTGMTSQSPSEQCYWSLTAAGGELERDSASLAEMSRARLVYSYRLSTYWQDPGPELRVLVSNNGFNNCSHDEGTGCRIIEEYHHHNMGRASQFSDQIFRTEMWDVSDFDGEDDVQVKFVADTQNVHYARIYDVHFVGWKVE